MDPVISFAVEKVGDSMIEEVKMLFGMKEKVEEMKTELQWMESFLEDADLRLASQSQQSQSRVFKEQVFEIREARLDAEDVVDTYLVKLALRNRSGAINFIKRYGGILKHVRDVHVVGSEIEALNSKLSRLRLRLQTYGGLGSSTSSRIYTKSLQRRSYGHIQDRDVVGLEDNINEAVDLLLKGEEQVVSIYGMGGLGKTTLAKKVYHEKRVRTHFDKFAWVYVSQQFKERDVWESTLIQLTCPSREEQEEILKLEDSELVAELSQVQKDHKCVVVLDDIWSIEDWENLQAGFPLEETRISTMIFTTRNANHRGGYGGLKRLKDPQDMELLRKIAFQGRDLDITEKEMQELGRGMLKHCGGLPLAITVLGGILASKDSLSEWQTVRDNINAYLRRGRGHDEEQGLGVHQVLAYSYYDLPSQLKTCFLYLSQFPEDYEIKTGELMRMWMAEGFVSMEHDGEGEETLEDVAERYLNELVGRCIVEVSKKGYTGKVKTCRLHDLMRDVCLSKAKEESLIHSYKSDAVTKGNIRRLSFIAVKDTNDKYTNDTLFLSDYEAHSHIRSLTIIRGLICWQGVFTFRLLKMLRLECVYLGNVKDLSKKIWKLIHLRYLSLRRSLVYDLPSLDELGCIETLDLRVDFVYKKKPVLKIGEIWKMKQLRHLYLPELGMKYSTDGDNVPIQSNSNLQTLVNFPPPNCNVGGILIKFHNLRKLRLLQGKHVVELWEVLNNSKGFSLGRLHSFALTSNFEGEAENVDMEVVVITCPHLYKLSLDGYIEKFPQLNRFPTKLTELFLQYSRIQDPKHIETTLGNLPHLRSLKLGMFSFQGEKLSFNKHTFPRLTTLSLSSLIELKNWTVEGAMPNLERLVIFDVDKLEAIPEGLRFIATLKVLKIITMPAEFEARLKERGADFDTVKHIPSITFKYLRLAYA